MLFAFHVDFCLIYLLFHLSVVALSVGSCLTRRLPVGHTSVCCYSSSTIGSFAGCDYSVLEQPCIQLSSVASRNYCMYSCHRETRHCLSLVVSPISEGGQIHLNLAAI